MPQDSAFLKTGDSTVIAFKAGELPDGFDTLSQDVKEAIIQFNHLNRSVRTEDNSYSQTIQKDESSNAPFIYFGIFLIFIIFIALKNIINASVETEREDYTYDDEEEDDSTESPDTPVLVYEGKDLNFTSDVYNEVLTKHLPFYNKLIPGEKMRFLTRLKNFIQVKRFTIHDTSGFREMPILISATAVQITFGLEKYLLPHFDSIHIFPREFLGTKPFVRFLEGNVSENNINISWQHFLEGFEYPDDGQNVGLHEMAHALYYQNFIAEENPDELFKNDFFKFDSSANKVFEREKVPGNDLYSDYALRNPQEFWAESVEIFFEKPVILKSEYPDLYDAVSKILNQYPADK